MATVALINRHVSLTRIEKDTTCSESEQAADTHHLALYYSDLHGRDERQNGK